MAAHPQITFRLTPEDLAILDALMVKLGVNRVDVVRIAVRRLADHEGVRPSPPKTKRKK